MDTQPPLPSLPCCVPLLLETTSSGYPLPPAVPKLVIPLETASGPPASCSKCCDPSHEQGESIIFFPHQIHCPAPRQPSMQIPATFRLRWTPMTKYKREQYSCFTANAWPPTTLRGGQVQSVGWGKPGWEREIIPNESWYAWGPPQGTHFDQWLLYMQL